MTHKGNETRRKIIEKSLQIFSVKGYFNTSVNDILQATGLTKGGLYGHFSSKEEIWQGVYEEAVRVWDAIVFEGLKTIENPMERIEKAAENYLRSYIGGGVFEGGCFFLNMLVELSGQSPTMTGQILEGINGFTKLVTRWLEEADSKGILKPAVNCEEAALFIVTSLIGTSALCSAKGDSDLWVQTLNQLQGYLAQLGKERCSPSITASIRDVRAC